MMQSNGDWVGVVAQEKDLSSPINLHLFHANSFTLSHKIARDLSEHVAIGQLCAVDAQSLAASLSSVVETATNARVAAVGNGEGFEHTVNIGGNWQPVFANWT